MMNKNDVQSALYRLRAGGPTAALRLIVGLARDNVVHDPTVCADCALLERIADIAETGLQIGDLGDAEIVAGRLKELECKLSGLEVWGAE